mgnify:CR=1 FL=1
MSAPMPQPLTLSETALALRAGTVTSVGLTEAAIAAADRHDGALGVYLARFDERARAAALRADEELARGLDRGPLHGIPFGVKDTIAVADGPTTAQSLVHDRAWWAGRDAPVVARLRAAGAVITGKTTAMEFGCGLPEEDEPFPFPRNPWRPDLWAGGSSSGSASGVAAGFFTAALGGDTGGSIRMPAAFCGVSGLLPTFGRVPGAGASQVLARQLVAALLLVGATAASFAPGLSQFGQSAKVSSPARAPGSPSRQRPRTRRRCGWVHRPLAHSSCSGRRARVTRGRFPRCFFAIKS